MASNLVSDDTNGAIDVFLHQRTSHTTLRVSIASDGTQANGHSFRQAISGDGTVTAFVSEASNLVADDSNGRYDVFVHTLPLQRLPPAADTYVRAGLFANQNFDTAQRLLVKMSNTADNARRTYLKFDVGDIDTISTATLRLYGRVSHVGTPRVRMGIYPVSNESWDEQSVTWNTKPAYGAMLGQITVRGTTPQWVTIDVTDFVRAQKKAGRQTVSFTVRALERTNGTPASNPEKLVCLHRNW